MNKKGENFMPWEDVDRCRKDKRIQTGRIAVETVATFKADAEATCLECGKVSDELQWFYFRSPAFTWKHLCGRKGVMVVCDNCRRQVAFFLTIMS
ncbi:MAG: hypothetical protein QM496_05175 [Verrucomicrobiota bacterium]